MIQILQVPKGEYVIQSAAASVTGRMFIQLAKHKGIKTVNLVRRDSQIEELKAIGADEVINYTKEDVVDRVKQLTGGKLAYAGIDCVCGDMTQLVASSVRTSGEVLLYGFLESMVLKMECMDFVPRNVRLQGYSLAVWMQTLSPTEKQEVAQIIMGVFEKKIIHPFSGEKFPLSKFNQAIAKSEEDAHGGKVLLMMSKSAHLLKQEIPAASEFSRCLTW
ncbi:unnamed protein product [Sphagnum troendelagicum]|uniref:Alcohol dehydrogenase-like C-terminal domain-containing protein n=1 Tax=Sphagnum troendelagicum TaxID=128251 RepID=A0ABP0UIL6_9BRYO